MSFPQAFRFAFTYRPNQNNIFIPCDIDQNVARDYPGTENMNMNEIEPPPLRALWFHFEDKMDYNTVR